jgi:hypothetical protein
MTLSYLRAWRVLDTWQVLLPACLPALPCSRHASPLFEPTFLLASIPLELGPPHSQAMPRCHRPAAGSCSLRHSSQLRRVLAVPRAGCACGRMHAAGNREVRAAARGG